MNTPIAIGRVREPRSPHTPNSGAVIMYTTMKAGQSAPSCVSDSPMAPFRSGTSGGTR